MKEAQVSFCHLPWTDHPRDDVGIGLRSMANTKVPTQSMYCQRHRKPTAAEGPGPSADSQLPHHYFKSSSNSMVLH